MKLRRIVTFLLAACMIFAMLPTGIAATTYLNIIPGATYTGTIAEAGGSCTMQFTPAITGLFRYCGDGEENAVCRLYDSNWTELKYGDDNDWKDFIITYTLEAGKTYYYSVSFWDEECTGTYTATLEQLETEPLVLGAPHIVNNESDEDLQIFSYTPAITGTHYFYSLSNMDTVGVLYNSAMDNLSCQDWGGYDNNFCISYNLVAGQTYYFMAYDWYRSTDPFVVTIGNEDTNHYSMVTEENPMAYTVDEADGQTYFVIQPQYTTTYYLFSFASGDTHASLYDQGLDLVAEDDNSEDGHNFRISCTLNAGEFYYLVVDSAASGSIPVYVTIDPTISAADFEALQVDVGAEAVSLGSNPSDYFVVTPETSGTYYFYSVSGIDTVACLYDENMNEVVFSDGGGEENNFQFSCSLLAGKTYYLEAQDWYNSSTKFAVVMTKSSDRYYNYLEEDSLDAIKLTTTGRIGYFYFVPDETTTYYCFSIGENNTSATIYDTDWNAVTMNAEEGTGGNFRFSAELTAGKGYFIAATMDVTGSIPVYITTDPGISAADFETLQLDVGAEAVSLGSNPSDYFVVTPETSGTYYFYSVSGIDTVACLYDENMNEVVFSDGGGRDNNFLFSYALVAGKTYYLEAQDWYKNSTQFAVVMSMSSDRYYNYVDEGSLSAIKLTTNGRIGYFYFVPDETTTYYCFSIGGDDTSAVLYDADWNAVAVNTESGTGGNFRFSAELTAGRGYYIAATADAGGSIPVYITNDPSVNSSYFPTLEPEKPAMGQLPVGSKYTYFTFTPEQTGTYYLYSIGDRDTMCALLDENFEQLSFVDDYNDANFFVEYQLIAGYTYYYAANFWGSADSSINVFLSQDSTVHNFEIETVAPTCTTSGYSIYTCADCGVSYVGAQKEPTPHNYRVSVKAPTCISQGYTTYTCTACGHSYVGNYTEPVAHSYTSAITAPGCTTQGYTTYTCAVCGHSYLDNYTDALGHSYSATVTQPTCTSQGYTTYTCSRCGDSYVTNYTSPLGHSYACVITAPTCTAQGYTTYTCSRCGTSYVDDYVAPAGHQWDNGVVTKEPSETNTGIRTYTCTACGAVTEEVIPKKDHEHNFVCTTAAPTCTEQGYTTYSCSGCGYSYTSDYVAPLGHSYQDTVVAPTCTEQGCTVHTCSLCGHSYVDSYVPTEDHVPGEPVVENFVSGDCTHGSTYDEVVYCTVCGAELSRISDRDESMGHVPGEQVIENYVSGGCTEFGSYDEVVYCTVCGAELSRTTVNVTGEGHMPGDTVIENMVDASCTQDGHYDQVTYCEVCGVELERTTEIIEAEGHSEGDTVIENEKEASCTEDGGYDEVCYCENCGQELSRETIVQEAFDHDFDGGICQICGIVMDSPILAPEVSATNVASTGKIKLSWDAVDEAVEYEIYRSNSRNGTYSLVKTTTSTEWTDSNAKTGKSYYYYVVAVKNPGEVSEPSNTVNRTCDCAQPEITLSNVASSGKIKVSWDEVEGAVSYEVYRATSKNGEYTKIKTTTSTSYTDTSAKAGTAYYYKVRVIAQKSAANSAYSKAKSRTCDLARPTITLTNVASSGKIKVSWDKVDGAVKYKVYRATSKNGTYELVKTTKSTSYTNTSAEAGETYYYKVIAVAEKSAANSAYSTIKSRTCDLARPTVTLTNVASSGKIKVTWKAVEGATSYKVYRATSENGTYKLMKTTTSTSYINSSAEAGKTYYYKVVAVCKDSAANSAYSAVKSRTCDLERPDVSISRTSSGKPRLTWDKVDGAVEYKIYRATSRNGEYTLVKTTKSTSWTNTGATSGKTYYYKVVAVASKSAANSAYSTVVYIKVK